MEGNRVWEGLFRDGEERHALTKGIGREVLQW